MALFEQLTLFPTLATDMGQEINAMRLKPTQSIEPNPQRIIRLPLDQNQVALLVKYAINHGWTKSDNMSYQDESIAVKYAIMDRLGFK